MIHLTKDDCVGLFARLHLLLAAYMHGKRNAIQRILEEIENGSDVL